MYIVGQDVRFSNGHLSLVGLIYYVPLMLYAVHIETYRCF